MKRDFLKNLDLGEGAHLPDAAIDAIMAEYGKSTAPMKDLTAENAKLKAQLAEAQEWESRYNSETPALAGQLAALQKDIDARNARDKVAAETGVPAGLLTAETEEACRAQADALNKWRGPAQNYPTLSDGGETLPASRGETRDQFAQQRHDPY